VRKILRLIGSPCPETVFRDADEFSDEVIKVLLMNWLYTKLTATKTEPALCCDEYRGLLSVLGAFFNSKRI